MNTKDLPWEVAQAPIEDRPDDDEGFSSWEPIGAYATREAVGRNTYSGELVYRDIPYVIWRRRKEAPLADKEAT